MLSGLCLALARRGRVVSVIGRRRQRLLKLARQDAGLGRIEPVAVDYRNEAQLGRELMTAIGRDGPIERAVCWVHEESAPDAPLWVARHVHNTFLQVLGSASADPSQPEILEEWRARFRTAYRDLDYRIAVLGFIRSETGLSRWLTDHEICDGVESALDAEEPLSIVGTVEPWSARP